MAQTTVDSRLEKFIDWMVARLTRPILYVVIVAYLILLNLLLTSRSPW